MRRGKQGADAPRFPACQQQLSLQLLLQPQLQLQPQPQPPFQFPQPQELPQFPQPQEPLPLPQQQNRTRMTMIHRQELLFPLLKHIAKHLS